MTTRYQAQRLEHLRQQIRHESISYDEIHELQSLADCIDPGDVELLEWAGVPEFQGGDLLTALEAAACDSDGRILIESVYREDED